MHTRTRTTALVPLLLVAALVGTTADGCEGPPTGEGAPPALVSAATSPHTMYLSGTVRCTAGTWAAVNDTAHHPYGITSVTSSSTWVRVAHATIPAVGSVQATADETYVADDVTVGASVGLSYIELHFAQGGVPVAPSSVCTAYSNVWLTGWADL